MLFRMEQEMEKLPQEDTLNFVYAHTKDATERQVADIAGLEGKMVQLLAAGSVVIGLAGLSTNRAAYSGSPLFLLFMGVVTYLLLAITAILQLWPRGVRRSIHADILWPNYWDVSPIEIKHALVQDISDAYQENAKLLGYKKIAVVVGLGLIAFEVTAVGTAILISLFRA